MNSGAEMNRQAMNITALREEAKLTQKGFALMISELINRDIPFTVGTISAWETGKRSPTPEVVEKMSELFGVSPDFIRGKTSIRNGDYKPDEADNRLLNECISPFKLTAYNDLPVYVTFPDKSHKDGWGVVDIVDNQIFIWMKGRQLQVKQDSTFKIYPRELSAIVINETESHNPLGMIQITTSNHTMFWVSYITANSDQRRYFDGWYKLTPNKEYLIKDNKLVLSLSGLNIHFKVFAQSPQQDDLNNKSY